MGKLGKVIKAITEDNRPECGVKREGKKTGFCTKKKNRGASTCGSIECETTYWNGRNGFNAYQ